MTQEQAKALVINADENVLQGWLDLQQMWFNNRNDPKMLKAGITDWQTATRKTRARKCCQPSW
jgi:outer membrane PBP1 activator LpoA protein